MKLIPINALINNEIDAIFSPLDFSTNILKVTSDD